MNGNLLNALLSMDAYNRGYDPGVKLHEPGDTQGQQLGDLTITSQSSVISTSQEVRAGFYALSYYLGGGQTIISYRGTDQGPSVSDAIGLSDLTALFTFPSFSVTNITAKIANNIDSILTPDLWNGWFIGAGAEESAQALLAFEYYKDVVGGHGNVYSANVSLTGHSLGGGLAGLVGGAYGQNVTMFDQMPFEKALQDTFSQSVDPNSSDYDDTLKQVIYGDGLVNGPSYLSHQSFSVEGEALSSIRKNPLFGLITTSTIPDNALNLGSTLALDQLTDVQRHSQALLVIRMFFAQEDGLPQAGAWDMAAKYFWPVLFDAAFSQSIGMDSVDGGLKGKGEYDGILRTILAYSVVDEGEDAARPFGDTGIRALYNDANDLGGALTASGAGSTIEDLADNISETFVHFSGQLALNKVLQMAVPGALAVDGVLTYSDHGDNQNLTLNFSEGYWSSVLNTTEHSLDFGRNEFMVSMLNVLGIDSSDILDATLNAWGNGSYTVFDRVVLSTTAGGTSVIEESSYPDSAKASLFIGGVGADNVTGSSGNDLILAGAGDDVIDGGAGNDIYIGGAGNDTYIGGAGFDTLSLDGLASGVTISIPSYGYHSPIDDQSYLAHDNSASGKFTDIENFVLTTHDDIIYNDESFAENSVSFIDAGQGIDTLRTENQNGMVVTADGIYDSTDSLIKNVEIIDIVSSGRRYVADTDGPGWGPISYPLPGNIYIQALGHSFDIGNTSNQRTVNNIDYSQYSFGGLTFDIEERSVTVSDGALSDTITNAFSFAFIGTNFGDTVNFANDSRNSTFWAGFGNDTIHLNQPSNINSTNIVYSGGLDHVYTNGRFDDLIFAPDIDFSTVTYQEVNVDLKNDSNPFGEYFYDLNVSVNGQLAVKLYDLDSQYGPLSAGNNFYGWNQYWGIKGSPLDDNLTSFSENIQGFAGNDVLRTYNSDGSLIQGGLGDDVIHGYFGGDYIFGNHGNDILYGYDGFDEIHGGWGDDELYGGNGIDVLFGGAGLDNIYGGADNDWLYGGAGNDQLFGENGRDTLDGGLGSNFLDGGADNDTYYFTQGNITVTDASGFDVLYFPTSDITELSFTEIGSTDLKIDVAGIGEVLILDQQGNQTSNGVGVEAISFGIVPRYSIVLSEYGAWTFMPAGQNELFGSSFGERLVGTSNADIITINNASYAHGGNGNDLIVGGDYSNTIYGGNGNDSIYGGAGTDIIYSDNGHDLIYGESGNDTIIGGVGNDIAGYVDTYADYVIGGTLGSLSVTDTSGNEGSDTLEDVETLQFSDGDYDVASGVFTPNGGNTAPIAVDDIAVTDEDVAVSGNVLTNDTDADGDTLKIAAGAITSVQGGSVTLLENGDFTYTPAAGFFGADSFDYTVDDGNNGFDDGTVNITVNEAVVSPNPIEVIVDNQDGSQTSTTGSWVNSSGANPHAGNSVYTYTNGESFTWNPNLSADSEYEVAAWWTYWSNRDTSVTYEVHHVDGVANVEVNQRDQALDNQWNSLGSYTLNQSSFVRVVHDGGTFTTSADAVRFTPDGGNRPPVAVDDSAVTDEDVAVSGNVLTNDTDADGDTLKVTPAVIASVQGGSVTLLENGDYTYTPADGFFGADSFTYTVDDGNEGFDNGTVNITVNEAVVSPNPIEVIVDNQDGSQTSTTGSWVSSSGANPHAGNSVYTYTNGESFTWNPNLSADSEYEIAAWWTYWSNRDTSVTYEVHHVGGVANVELNQRDQTLDGQWNSLGSYTLNQSSFVRVVHDGGTSTTTSADAVRFNPATPPAPIEVIVDNQDGSQTSSTGSWTSSSGAGPHAGNSVFANANGESFTWNPNLSADSEYEIAAWWTYWSNRDTSVTYEVHHVGGVANIEINQRDQTLDSQWNSLGSYTLDQSSFVRVVHDGGTSTTTSADALRFAPVVEPAALAAVEETSNTLYGTSGADSFIFEAISAFTGVSTVQDFNLLEGDTLDVSDLLSGYDPLAGAIEEFVQITNNGADSALSVDANGGADNFVQIATLIGVTDLTNEESLETSGHLITV